MRASRRMAAGEIGASWFEDARGAPPHHEGLRDAFTATRDLNHATWLRLSAAYSGSTSQMTRLRPLRLAA